MTLAGARRAYLVWIGQEAAGESLYLYLRTIRLHGRDLVVDEVVA